MNTHSAGTQVEDENQNNFIKETQARIYQSGHYSHLWLDCLLLLLLLYV